MPSITELCRELRKRQTPVELVLWEALRNRKLQGKKFLRQHPICALSSFSRNIYYIPDFYCHEAKLAIEADGPIHIYKQQYDRNRDEVLKALGSTVLRFTNKEIESDLHEVLRKIAGHL
ncbi:endonuclease domain-containing protein [Mucilaginibacter sp.]|uniref:endonuclease domain-containing protein n=1 Tax=Mucilaginibacter sp. TaxID=1882438 RepID=UPI0035BC6813